MLSVDEKSQIQALDRTQPGLPMKKGRAGTMTHDYKRDGTTAPFASMNVLDGTVIGRNMQRQRHQEFIRFLNAVDREVPAGKTIHAILDNSAAHKHPTVRRWLARHPRWTFHFAPTSASWLNPVEGFFAILTKRRLKRGVFLSVADLQSAINGFLDNHTARRGRQTLDSIHFSSPFQAAGANILLLAIERFKSTAVRQGKRHDHENDGWSCSDTRVGYRRTGNASRSFLRLGSSVG